MAQRALSDDEERELVLYYLLKYPIKALCEWFGIPRPTVYRVLHRHDIQPERPKGRGKVMKYAEHPSTERPA